MPRNRSAFGDLSLEEIQAQLAQLETQEEALQEALQERRAAELAELVKDLRQQIAARGYSLDEVLAQLGKGVRKRSEKVSGTRAARYLDPDNPARSYSRGPLPAWLREKMEAAGYDPADKAQRDEFKATHMQLAA